MAVSGSIDYTVTAEDVITEALELLGVLGEGESPNTNQLDSSRRTLNMMVKTWQADGLNLFAVQKLYLFLIKDTQKYTLDSSTTAHFTSSFTQTTVDGAVSSGNTSVTLSDATGATNGDNIGLYQDDGTMHWTTLSGAPSGNSINLTDATTDDLSDGAVVYFYSDKANRPMKVMEAYTFQYDSTEIPVKLLSRREYDELSDKDSEGFVNQVYFDPQRDTSNLYVWPTTSNERDYIILVVQRTLNDLDSNSDTLDYPQEWFMPLSYGLAMYLAPKYGTPRDDYNRVLVQANSLYEMAKGFDAELYTSVYFEPDWTTSYFGR